MSTPPRRSRPKKPGETIDSTAERLNDEPPVPQTADAPGGTRLDENDGLADPEARLGANAPDAGETAPDARPGTLPGVETSGVSVLGEPEKGDINAPATGEPAGRHDAGPEGTLLAEAASAGPVAGENDRPIHADDAAQARSGDALSENEAGAANKRDTPEEFDAEAVLGTGGPHAGDPSPTELNYHHTPTVSEPAQGPGFGSLLGAGLVGAALALLIGGGLQYAGVVPAVRGPDTDQLAQQFARAGDVQQLATDLNTARGDIGQLQSTVAAGGAGGQTGPSGADFAALADRFNNLEGRVNGLGAAPANAAPAIDPAVVRDATDAASGARAAAESAQAAAMGAQGRADEARQTAQTAQQAADTARQAAAVAQEAANGALETARANGQAIEEVRNRIGSVEDANRRAAVAIAAAGLKAAVDRGGPFMSELETYATAVGPSPAVDALRDYAANGVPANAVLQNDWPDVRTAVLRALRPVDPNAGVGQQILSGLNSLVAVRPSGQGDAAGAGASGPQATVARLDSAMENGDLDAWTREWATLPQPARDAGADFERRVAARAQAERVVGEALAGAVNQTGTAD